MFEFTPALLVQALLGGVLVGGIYSLIGVGLSLQWGVMRVPNISYPAFVFMSAYIAYWTWVQFKLDPIISLVISLPTLFLLGAGIQLFLGRIRVTSASVMLITFGLLLVLQGGMLSLWTGNVRAITTSYTETAYYLGPIVFPLVRVLTFAISVGLVGAVYLFLERTYYGKAIRAIVDNITVATMYGVNPSRMFPFVFGLGAGMAALGGWLIALIFSFTPDSSLLWIGKIFAVVILAGMGSVRGVLAAGLILGVAETLTNLVVGTAWGTFAAYSLLIIVLVIRPRGVSGRSYE